MSTPSSCRREEVASCQPDKTILVEKPKAPPVDSECATMSEKQFLKYHSLYSSMSSWLFAIAGATNIGVLGVFSSKVLTAAEQGRPLFKSENPAIEPVMGNKRYNRLALGMIAFGGVCMCVSNWLESKKVVTEWQLGANKLNRRIAGAEREQKQMAAAADAASADADTPAPPSRKSWAASVQPKSPDTIERVANYFRAG